MSINNDKPTLALWQDVVRKAEDRCAIVLTPELESYLTSLLIRYANKPEVAQQIFATAFLEAMQQRDRERILRLQCVGDQCLLFAGLFPSAAERRHVKLSYFVDLGRAAYVTISQTADDLYWSLAFQFVALMDVLQSIRPNPQLLPIQAYEQWEELGSRYALTILKEYSHGLPITRPKR